MIGIYKIINPKGKVYIGQSVNIKRRLRRYQGLNTSMNGQIKLKRSIYKYGVDNHSFEVVEQCSEKDLNRLERYYQELYNCVDDGLNCFLTKTTDKSGRASAETLKNMSVAQKKYFSENKHPWEGRKHSEETKQKIRQKAIGRIFSDEINKKKGRPGRVSNRKGIMSKDHPRSKAILQYDLDGNLIKEWICGMDIKRELGYNVGNISSCCNGNLKTSKGFIWKFKI